MTLPVVDFLVQRMQEYDSQYELRPGTAFTDLFILPLSYITQPIVDEIAAFETGQSIIRILQLDDPDSYPTDKVDGLVGNLFVTRITGSLATGTVRMLYLQATDVNYLARSLEFRSSTGLKFYNRLAITGSASEIIGNTEAEYYYLDILVDAESPGESYNVEENGIVYVNDINVIKVYNPNAFTSGVNEETNTEVLNRTMESIGVRDMNTTPGLMAVMYEQFSSFLTYVRGIGFLDPEMMRDIYYNFHIGGMIDVWLKTNAILDGEFQIDTINVDLTRELSTTAGIQMTGTDWLSLGTSSLSEETTPLSASSTEPVNESASFVSYVDLVAGVDLSVNKFISFSMDTLPKRDINVAGIIPKKTQAHEIVNAINRVVGATVATTKTNPTIVNTVNTGNTTVAGSLVFLDPTPGIFRNVYAGDKLAIIGGTSAGSYTVSSKTSDNELVLTTAIPDILIGANYSITRSGTYIGLVSTTKSQYGFFVLGRPSTGGSALSPVFGLSSDTEFKGTGPYVYTRDEHYAVDTAKGAVSRVIGPTIISTPSTPTGVVQSGILFSDSRGANSLFGSQEGDILTINWSTGPVDYRIIRAITTSGGVSTVQVDTCFHQTVPVNVQYSITRTAIKNGEVVLYAFNFHPLSIDIGALIQQGEYGRTYDIRKGREDYTIKDTAYLWTERIEVIDPATGSPLGQDLDAIGGFGQGNYGEGPYGIGNRAEYRLYVNKPELRFSPLEDSLIIINDAYLGESLKVYYKYVPDVDTVHAFATSDANRVLDAQVVAKHCIPALVSMTVLYKSQSGVLLQYSDSEVTQEVMRFINDRPGLFPIDSSDIIQTILTKIDPAKTAGTQIITPFTMRADIHNTDGSLTIVSSPDSLQIPNETIPPYTVAPLSPRTAHWIAYDITVRRVT